MGYDNMDHGGWVQNNIDAVRTLAAKLLSLFRIASEATTDEATTAHRLPARKWPAHWRRSSHGTWRCLGQCVA